MSGIEWCQFIQSRIENHSKPTADPHHRWTSSARLGEILCCWFSAVHRAKMLDPRRPIANRKRGDAAYMEWLLDLTASIHQTRMLPELFPGQEWESPFIANATNGTFV